MQRFENDPIEDETSAEMDTRLIWAGLFFAIALFSKIPQLDLMATARYFSPELGFIYRDDPIVQWLYWWTPWIGRGLIVILALVWAFNSLWGKLLLKAGQAAWAEVCTGVLRTVAMLMVIASLLGPGLVIEGIFKNTAGRPRPVQVQELGGTVAYQGPFQWGPNTENHKSFVSSHAAAGFALMGLGLSCGPIWRRRWFWIGTISGGVIGMGRMMQGGHFLSDIIFSFYSVWICCELVRWWHLRRSHSPQTR